MNPEKYILDKIYEQFKDTPLWTKHESDITLLCTEYDSTLNKDQKIHKLKEIRGLLLQKGAIPDNVMFINNEISSIEDSKQIKLYEEGALVVNDAIVKKFSDKTLYQEGIISANYKLNWSQLKDLTSKIFISTQEVKFFITPDQTFKGQIIAHNYETPIEIPVLSVYKTKSKNKETNTPLDYKIALFGESVDRKKYVLMKEITENYYLMQFLSEDNKEYSLLCDTKIDIGDYTIKGVMTKLTDNKRVSDSARLFTKMPYIFVHSYQNRITQFKNHEEFNERLKILMVTHKTLFDFPFTNQDENKKDGKLYLLHHPTWFKWMIWAWLAHASYGSAGFHPYPLHIFMMAKQSTGKTSLLNALLYRNKEKGIFSGSASTLKGLIPSFKHTPVKIGHMGTSNRFALIDEFLRCIFTTNTGNNSTNREEIVGLMNDLLEHQKRVAGSGVSSVALNMTSRAFATSNPARGIRDVVSMVGELDNSFLSRWLIYWQDEDHINLIKNNEGMLDEYPYKMTTSDWLSILDYLHSFSADVDMKKLREIYNSVKPVLSKDLLDLYMSRHIHHLACIGDGIVKARCTFEHDMSFKANDEDYKIIEEVWKKVIRSWIPVESLRDKTPKDKLLFMPEDCQWFFNEVCKKKRPLSNFELKELHQMEFTDYKFTEVISILYDQNLLKQNDDGLTVPYWWSDTDEFCKN